MTDGETKPTFAKYPWGGEVFIPSTAWERHDLLTCQLCLTFIAIKGFLGGMRSLWKIRLFMCFSFGWFWVFLFCYKYFELIWFAVHWSRQNGGVPCPCKVSCWSHLAAGIKPTPFSRFLSSWETRRGGCTPDAGAMLGQDWKSTPGISWSRTCTFYHFFLHYLDTSKKNPPQTGPSRL